MNIESVSCFQVPIKSAKQQAEFSKRQTSPIPGTPKIILGKKSQGKQQIWTEEFKKHKTSSLRHLRSNSFAFEVAEKIVHATDSLSRLYGNFILNENMVFSTKSKNIFIWINPDIFVNSPKIYLPQTKEGEISMIKGLVNYFKLWLQANYASMLDLSSLKQLSSKISQQKASKSILLPKSSRMSQFSISSSTSDALVRLYQSSKAIHVSSFNIHKSKQQKQQSEQNKGNSQNQKYHTNRYFPNQSLHGKYFKKKVDIEEKSQNFSKTSNSNGVKGSVASSFCKEFTRSFRSLKTNKEESKFPNKTTSSTLHIIHKIKQQDQNPDLYPTNKILQEQPQLQNLDASKGNIKKQGLLQQVDNLFKSNIESQENSEIAIQRELQFEQILDI